jgi:hypothetical protein
VEPTLTKTTHQTNTAPMKMTNKETNGPHQIIPNMKLKKWLSYFKSPKAKQPSNYQHHTEIFATKATHKI